ncbi:23S rRNA (adenine(2030)-N(6))-methyltransferase RlmJ [Aureimonas sp. AU40]|uniref:23S rRNA (adenine(2030)-N(6))-methyltransferase RlmJ n=1 Tax=Aureimonas sp. AU40 TaxID=1637747 RepID=UPI000782A19A|nr:23S rRNA (adenine(2030)-N(6))-methyltransferase RlmJ [Aureimonas sp. AU40]
MNYRHAFHAGNFADVVKHALFCRLIGYLQRKEKPFRVMDTHAGRGLYDLDADEARRTGEAVEGIDRLVASPAWDDPLLAEYRAAVEAARARFGTDTYPGSPLIARQLLRRQDRLSAYELHPVDAGALGELFAGDSHVKAIELDGWLALGAHVPPKEKRGIVLIDPPFERTDEIETIVEQLARAHARWPGGVYAVWYPIKRPAQHRRFHDLLRESGIPNIVAADFRREPHTAEERLVGTGLVVVNPPYTFAAEAEAIFALLQPVLTLSPGAECGIHVLAEE